MVFSHILERNSLSWKSWLETSHPIMSSIICFEGHIYSHSAFFIDLVQDEGLGHNCKTLMNRCLLHGTTQIIFQASQHSAAFSVWTFPRISNKMIAAASGITMIQGPFWFQVLIRSDQWKKENIQQLQFLLLIFFPRARRSHLFLFIRTNFSTGLYGDTLQ